MIYETIDQVVDHILERISANALEINWRSAATISSASQRKGNRKGPGFEQHGFKEYDPADGDQANHIDFNASAAESEDTLIVKVYKRPRVTCLTVLLDVNESMNTGSVGFKSYLGAIAAGCGIKAAEKSRDRTSFVTYAEQPISIFKLMDPLKLFLQAIYAAIEDRSLPPPLTNGVTSDWRSRLRDLFKRTWHKAISSWRRLSSKELFMDKPAAGGGLSLALEVTQRTLRSVYLVVSDFVNMNEEDWDALQSLGGTHDVIAAYVQDERERKLPAVLWPGMYFSLVDYRGEKVSFWIAPDRSPLWFLKSLRWLFGSVTTREQFAENFKRYEEEILGRLQDCGVTTVVVRTDDEDEAIQQLLQVLSSKSRS
jgi:uncharacterized protein (DUF58 family)